MDGVAYHNLLVEQSQGTVTVILKGREHLNAVVPEMMVGLIADRPPVAVGSAKAAISKEQTLDFGSAMAWVYNTCRLTIGNVKFLEGRRAVLEQRRPKFARR